MSARRKQPWAWGGTQGRRPQSGQPMWPRWLGAAVLALLALHSLSYGSGFVANPVEAAREFGDNMPPSEAAEHLAGLVGVFLLLLALTAVIAGVLLLRRHLGGPWLTLGLGIAMLVLGAYWGFLGSAWDCGIYGAFGLLLTGTGIASLRYARQARQA